MFFHHESLYLGWRNQRYFHFLGRNGTFVGLWKMKMMQAIREESEERLRRKKWGEVWLVWAIIDKLIFFLSFFRATPMAYGSSQARGQIRSVAAVFCTATAAPPYRYRSRSICNLYPSSQQRCLLNPLSKDRDCTVFSDLLPLSHDEHSLDKLIWEEVRGRLWRACKVSVRSFHDRLQAMES